jgi:trigger factor
MDMQLPGMPGIPGATEDPVLREKAEEEAERLLEDLKKEVKADIREIGTLRKELRITVPAKIIAEHLDHNYDELRHDATVPGFRRGHAPRRLIEKRFGSEVRESLTTSIVGQSYFAVTEKHELDVLGEPLFRIESAEGGVKLVEFDEALQHLKLPPEGDFDYVCEIEVKPTFELPELKDIEIKSPEIEITDQMVTDEMLRQRKLRGRFEPQPEGAAERDDLVIADVVLTVDGKEIKTEENAQLGVRPAAVGGVQVPELDKVLEGAKPGDTRKADCTIPEDYERADIRGQKGRFSFRIHELKRLVPMALDEFLQRSGFENETEACDYFRMVMERERDEMIDRAKRAQVEEFLLEKTSLDLPENLSARQIGRAVTRRMIELRQLGMPEDEVLARADELRSSAKEEVTRELKLGFILGKAAEKLEIQVTDEEVNTAIAMMARRYNRRFDRVRDELQQEGLLSQLAERIRQDKTVNRLLEDAKLVEVKPKAKADKAGKAKASPAKAAQGEDTSAEPT